MRLSRAIRTATLRFAVPFFFGIFPRPGGGQEILPCAQPARILAFDGLLAEEDWSRAATVQIDHGAPKGATVDCRLLADNRMLYLGWVVSGVEPRDLVGSSFFPAAPGNPPRYAHLRLLLRSRDDDGLRRHIEWTVGVDGQLHVDSRGTPELSAENAASGAGARVATSRTADGWSGELAVPLASVPRAPGAPLTARIEHTLRRTSGPPRRAHARERRLVFPVQRPDRRAPISERLDPEQVVRAAGPQHVAGLDLPGPPVSLLCIAPSRLLPEIAEIARGYDIDAVFAAWDPETSATVHDDRGALESSRRERLDFLLGYRWDAVLVASVRWSALPAEARERLVGGVFDGLGLVLVRADEGAGGPDLPTRLIEDPAVRADPAQLAAILADLPAEIVSVDRDAAAIDLGRGRIARLLHGSDDERGALAPDEFDAARPDAQLLRGDWLSVVARAVRWVATGDPQRLDPGTTALRWDVEGDPSVRRVTIRPGDGAGTLPAARPGDNMRIEILACAPDLSIADLREARFDSLRHGRLGAALFLSRLDPGTYRAIIRLAARDETIRWARIPVTVAPLFADWAVAAQWITPATAGPAQTPTLKVVVAGAPALPADNDTVRIEVHDGAGHLLAHAERAAGGTTEAPMVEELAVATPRTAVCRVRALYRRRGGTAAAAEAWIDAPARAASVPVVWLDSRADDGLRRDAVDRTWRADRTALAWCAPPPATGAAATDSAARSGGRIVWNATATEADPPAAVVGTHPTPLAVILPPDRAAPDEAARVATRPAPMRGWPPPEADAGVLFAAETVAAHPIAALRLPGAPAGSGLDFDPAAPDAAAMARWAPWQSCVAGAPVVAVGIRRPGSMVDDHLRRRAPLGNLEAEVEILHRGVGALLAAAGPAVADGMTMLWSDQCARSPVRGLVPHGDDEPIHLVESIAFAAALESVGYSPRVADEATIAGRLEPGGVLWLPWATDLEPEVVETIRRFVRDGGTVVADGMPGAASTPSLAQDFGVVFDGELPDPWSVRLRTDPTDPASEFDALIDASVRLLTAQPAQTVDGIPVACVRPDGRGRWVYLNLWMEPAAQTRLERSDPYGEFLRRLLRQWRVEGPPISVADESGAPIPDCRVRRLPWGTACELVVVDRLPSTRRAPAPRVTVRADRTRTWYDLRTSSALGSTPRLDLGPISAGAVRVFAAWDGLPPELSVRVETPSVGPLPRPVRVVVSAETGPLAVRLEAIDSAGDRVPGAGAILVTGESVAIHAFIPPPDASPGNWRIVAHDLVTDRIVDAETDRPSPWDPSPSATTRR